MAGFSLERETFMSFTFRPGNMYFEVTVCALNLRYLISVMTITIDELVSYKLGDLKKCKPVHGSMIIIID